MLRSLEREPGVIQPGPNGEVWTHPSGFADLQLTRGQTAAGAKAMPMASLQLGTAQPAIDRAEAPVLAPVTMATRPVWSGISFTVHFFMNVPPSCRE